MAGDLNCKHRDWVSRLCIPNGESLARICRLGQGDSPWPRSVDLLSSSPQRPPRRPGRRSCQGYCLPDLHVLSIENFLCPIRAT